MISQMCPSRSLKLRAYMKPYSIGSLASVPPSASALSTRASTASLFSAYRQVSTSVVLPASAISFLVNSLNFASVSSMV